MCEFCPEIVAYRLDGNRNLIPIYAEEPDDGAAADEIEQRAAMILARHSASGLPGERPLA